MPRKTTLIGGHIEVRLRSPGDYTWAKISGQQRTDREVRRDLATLESGINKKLSKFDDEFGGAEVVYEYEHTCGHCGAGWTEDGPDYNGGCCAEDENPGSPYPPDEDSLQSA